MKSFEPLLILFNSSNSSLYPSLINPPSCRVNGASSEIERSSKEWISSNVSIFLSYFNSLNISLIRGSTAIEFFN